MSKKESTCFLTVCVITYNHAAYIKEALDSVLAQEVDFLLEIVIADDCSTDGTRDILKEYQKKHPQLIHLILQERNVGPSQNWWDLIHYPSSKYVAYLEGDDYWTDTKKLSKQVAFLESNPGYTLCCHNISTNSSKVSAMQKNSDFEFVLSDTLKVKQGPSLTVVYLNILNTVKMPPFLISILSGDWAFEVLLLMRGKGHYMSDVMGYYRSHPGGVSTSRVFQKRKRKSKWIFISKMLFWSPKHAPVFLNFLVRNASWVFPKIKYLYPGYLFKKIGARLSSIAV